MLLSTIAPVRLSVRSSLRVATNKDFSLVPVDTLSLHSGMCACSLLNLVSILVPPLHVLPSLRDIVINQRVVSISGLRVAARWIRVKDRWLHRGSWLLDLYKLIHDTV